MQVQGEGISFYPLYWTFHDQWEWWEPVAGPNNEVLVGQVHQHYGHMHLFLLGYNWKSNNQDAFHGQQKFQFNIVDEWGPRAADPNQSHSYRVVGTPRWYFRVREVWRRVYIQPWDMGIGGAYPTAQRGLKWDACDADKRMGPFREGRNGLTNWSPYFAHYARTLPIDYFTADDKTSRTNHLATLAASLLGEDFDEDTYGLNHGNFLKQGTPGAKPTFSDALYIWPIIEYQTVTQLDWHRLPGHAAANDIDADNFGDGWSIDVSLPLISPLTGRYNSPFSATPGVVSPAGIYHGVDGAGAPLVPHANRLKHAKIEYDDPEHPPSPPATPRYYEPPLDQPPETSEQPITWNNPYGISADGRWVQQCLGGIVEAKAQVTIESKLGGRQDVWVHTTEYQPTTSFAGVDQGLPATV